MKIGKIVNTNIKGQIVIPQEYRKLYGINQEVSLNIVPYHNGLYIEPIANILPKINSEDVYQDVLRSTLGSWGKPTDQEAKQAKEKHKAELAAAKKRRQAW